MDRTRLRRGLLAAVTVTVAAYLAVDAARAQSPAPDLFVGMNDGHVHVYHTRTLPLGFGVDVFRKDVEEADFRKLTAAPLYPARHGAEFRALLGEELYEYVASGLEQDDPGSTYTLLRTNRAANLIYTFLFPEVARAMGRLYVDSTAAQAARTTYRLVVVDDRGQPTDLVLEQDVELEARDVASPNGLAAENADRTVTLKWQYPAGRQLQDGVYRFNVYRENGLGGQDERLNEYPLLRDDAVDAFSFSFPAQAPGREERYYVTAVTLAGRESAPSPALAFTPVDGIAPPVVEGLEAALLPSGEVTLSWAPSTAPDAAGYNVYRSVQMRDADRFERLNADPLESMTFRDERAAEGQQYFYRVTAVDGSGNESVRSTAASVIVVDRTAPPAPAQCTAEYRSDGSVGLQWELADIPADLQSYLIVRRELTRGLARTFSPATHAPVRTTSFVDAGPAGGFVEGAFYEFGIAAMDDVSNVSDTARVVLQIPDRTPPAPPTGVVAISEQGVRTVVNWNPSPSGDVVAYEVSRRPGDGRMPMRLSESRRSLRDESVEPGVRYVYAVTAIDSVGNESVAAVSDTLAVRDLDPPRAVRNVRFQADGEGISISWEPVNVPDLAGYRVYRATLATGVFEPVQPELISGVRWHDAAGAEGLWYRVLAVDTSGNESVASEPVQVR